MGQLLLLLPCVDKLTGVAAGYDHVAGDNACSNRQSSTMGEVSAAISPIIVML